MLHRFVCCLAKLFCFHMFLRLLTGILTNHTGTVGDPVDMMADQVVLKVNSSTPNLVVPVTKALVQIVIARMWELGEKYDVTEEVVKKVKVSPFVRSLVIILTMVLVGKIVF